MNNFKRMAYIKFKPHHIIILLGLILTGCGNLLSPLPSLEVNYYQISASKTSISSNKLKQKHQSSLYVSSLTANNPYNSQSMFYSKNNKIFSYINSKWISQPNDLLTQEFINSFNDTSDFANIVSGNFIGYADYRLTGNLNKLVQVRNKKGSSIVILSISYTLTSANSGQIISSKTFQTESNTKPGAVSFATTTSKLPPVLYLIQFGMFCY